MKERKEEYTMMYISVQRLRTFFSVYFESGLF